METAEKAVNVKEPIQNRSWSEWVNKLLISGLAMAIGIMLIAISQTRFFKTVNWDTPMAQVGLALVITGLTFILINQQLERGNREYTEAVVKKTELNIRGLLDDVQSQLNDLTKHNQILSGAIARDVKQIYAKRAEGLQDIVNDLRQSKHIKMLGISLREYFVPSGHYYRDMEEVLDGVIKSKDKSIQILLINPYSEQATIRAERESEKPFSDQNRYEDSGLYADVWQAIRYLSGWEKDLSQGEKTTQIVSSEHQNSTSEPRRIEARVYNSAPACFLVITDKHTYIEQYHYGMPKSGLVGGNFPLLKFPTLGMSSGADAGTLVATSVAHHLSGHFDYIWNQRGTSSLEHLLAGHNIGVSKSAWECRLANLFASRPWAEERIKYLISHESKEIKLIGISLRDFFHAGKGLYTAIQESSKSIRIRALMLDPLSEQGRFRSEREEPDVRQEGGNLFYEINTSIRSIERLQKEGSNVEARLYRASTNCFAIITSESVIVEQYHYGSAAPGATILGGKVSVLEYSHGSAMHTEIEGHFEHIWSKLSVNIEEWRREHFPAASPSDAAARGAKA